MGVVFEASVRRREGRARDRGSILVNMVSGAVFLGVSSLSVVIIPRESIIPENEDEVEWRVSRSWKLERAKEQLTVLGWTSAAADHTNAGSV